MLAGFPFFRYSGCGGVNAIMPRLSAKKIEPWQGLLGKSITRPGELQRRFGLFPEDAEAARRGPALVNPYLASLIKGPEDPIGRQFLPQAAELADANGVDPLCEEAQSPVPGMVHRYPDRVLLLVSRRCAATCRYCMRKRLAGGGAILSGAGLARAIGYVREKKEISEVILSGGDPLLLPDARLFRILDLFRAVPHVERLRIHTRVPGVFPARVTPRLCRGLARRPPLFLNVQVNHEAELGPRALKAFSMLADAGVVLGCQTVLLKGVNDDAETLARLFRKLLLARVKPYYLHQLDRVCGAEHFAVGAVRGAAIAERLWESMAPGDAPHYMLDLPGGGGKVPLAPGGGLGRQERSKLCTGASRTRETRALWPAPLESPCAR